MKKGGLNEEDDEFDSIVGTLQEIVLDPQFVQLQNNFFQKNCEVFEEVEENKIVYMEIFKSYQTILEDFINKVIKKREKNRLKYFFRSFKKESKVLK